MNVFHDYIAVVERNVFQDYITDGTKITDHSESKDYKGSKDYFEAGTKE